MSKHGGKKRATSKALLKLNRLCISFWNVEKPTVSRRLSTASQGSAVGCPVSQVASRKAVQEALAWVQLQEFHLPRAAALEALGLFCNCRVSRIPLQEYLSPRRYQKPHGTPPGSLKPGRGLGCRRLNTAQKVSNARPRMQPCRFPRKVKAFLPSM